ncbi:MAG: hypothetical protein ABSD59_09920 [Terracidiphilus sp.]|jgi:hypothetical protein
MKVLIVFVAAFLVSTQLFSQVFLPKSPVPLLASCGDSQASMAVKLDKSQHMLKQPEPGKARVYFFQDSFSGRIGLDGAWAGAVRGHSYFTVSVEPGEHHLCVSVDEGTERPFELTHFTAEAGRVYYFRGRVVPTEVGAYLFVDQPDSDESQYLLSAYSLAVWQASK